MKNKPTHRDTVITLAMALGVDMPRKHTDACHTAFANFKAAKEVLVTSQALCPKCKARYAVLRGDSSHANKQNT